MLEIDLSMVNWARAQFALTAMYHWLFVPLTLGLSFLCAFFETIYVRTGKEEWKSITKFWMTLFGINFAIGVATGIILEFEFGTNWSNYSWMVGDIFGAPLAIEGIFAFFLEATFFAVMFFGWNRVSKRLHLFSTWMVAVGANLSAVWILVANAWMQNPVGMVFNPDKTRFEMDSFYDVVFNPVAVAKFTHTSSSGFLFAALFVVTISSWYLLKKRHVEMAKRSIVVASVFGLISSGYVIFTGDKSAFDVADKQPVKFAAMEGMFYGEKPASLSLFGIVNTEKRAGDGQESFHFNIKVPFMLSYLATRSLDGFVPGIEDLVYGNSAENIEGAEQKIAKGKQAFSDLAAYKAAKKAKDEEAAAQALEGFRQNEQFLGYGYLDDPQEAVPPVPLTYYAFRVMFILGSAFPLLFLLILYFTFKNTITEKRWLLKLGMVSLLLGLFASQAGWIVAEVGRQPWAIQGFLPVKVATTNLEASNVQLTFALFFIAFTALLVAEIKIMLKQISIGPEGSK